MHGKLPKLSWPLSVTQIEKIHKTALDILENIGMAHAIPEVIDAAVKRGGKVNEQGRLCFPPQLVEEIIAACEPRTVLPGRGDGKPILLNDDYSHFGLNGTPSMVIDYDTGEYRNAKLIDLYDLIRLTDKLPNICTGDLMITPTDVTDPVENGVNATYAIMSATNKHVFLVMDAPEQLDPMVSLVEMIDGPDKKGKDATVDFSFCPTLSPLTYDTKYLTMMIEVAKRGYPVNPIIATMAGASAPATLAGTLAMTVAESLACLIAVKLITPDIPTQVAIWPFVSDLRTAAFSGGGAEETLLNCAVAQLIRWYGIEASVAAGMTDAKEADVQSGYEKGTTVSLAAIAGAQIIGESAGMQGSLMAVSYDAFVLDNDMLTNVNRLQKGIEVTDESLAYKVVEEVIKQGSGTFLGHPQTFKNMRTEYVYPELADRSTLGQWTDNGRPSLKKNAHKRTKEILSSHYPTYIEPELDARIRKAFPILVKPEDMRKECGRW